MKRLDHDMRACGHEGLPHCLVIDGQTWHYCRTFKHDFFACTGLYRSGDGTQQVVLKQGRTQPFLGIPMQWLGRLLCRRECRVIEQLKDIDQVPTLLSRFDRTGLVYAYIDGQSLDEQPSLPTDFFRQLDVLLTAIHRRDVCYVDMNKRGNILVGTDGRPYLIDFQIAMYLPRHWSGFIKDAFQREDRYHLLKHKRHFAAGTLSDDEWRRLRQKSRAIRLHRAIGRPLRRFRRWLLRQLYQQQIITPDPDTDRTPENDHRRFLR